jgi:hypothetical protein
MNLSTPMAKMRGVDPAFAEYDEPEPSCRNCPYRHIIFKEIHPPRAEEYGD